MKYLCHSKCAYRSVVFLRYIYMRANRKDKKTMYFVYRSPFSLATRTGDPSCVKRQPRFQIGLFYFLYHRNAQ